MTQYIPMAAKLCYALAGVIAILGTINICVVMYNKEEGLTCAVITTALASLTLILIAMLLS